MSTIFSPSVGTGPLKIVLPKYLNVNVNFCVHQNFLCIEILTLNVMILESETFGRD